MSLATTVRLMVSSGLKLFICVLDAVRRGDGRRVDGRRIIVDRELGRTKASWYPRRLGGGKGEARRDRRDEELIKAIKKQIDSEKEANKDSEIFTKSEEEIKGVQASA